MKQKIRVGIIGAGKGGLKVYRSLRAIEIVEIIRVCDLSDNALGMILAEFDGIHKSNSVEDVCKLDLDVIIDTTGQPEVQRQIEQLKSPNTSVLSAKGAYLLLTVLEENEKLRERKRLQAELEVLYNSAQEAIEVADKAGIIQYVNPFFGRVTGISPSERVGKNIFEVSPDGALARVLRTHEPIYAHRSKIEECGLEIIANASPIIVDGTIEAGLMVFHPLTDTVKLMEQIEDSKQVIIELQTRVDQSSVSLYTFDDILGSHPDFERIQNKARRSAKTKAPLLLLGESGTGKTIFAHAIHSASTRRNKPFVIVNCAEIPESLLEGELLGRGKSINGETSEKRLGKIELASGGTLFINEIGEMNSHLQTKLLHILQDKEFKRVGEAQVLGVDIRIIAATNRNLRERVNQGVFNADLYDQLNGVEFQIPSLREHKEDVLTYVQSFILRYNRKLGKNVTGITTHAEQFLLDYHWPGNIRELQYVIERAIDTVNGDMLHYKHFAKLIDISSQEEELNYREPMALDVLEKKMIRLALQRYGNSVEGKRRAAKVLNISLATLYNKLKMF